MNLFMRSIRGVRSTLVLVFFVLLPLSSHAGGFGTLNLQKTASFDKSLHVPDAIRADCQLDVKVIDFIESSAGADFDRIALVEEATPNAGGRTLAITITDLSGEGGGAWSGPKHLSIAGTLWKDGKVVGTFTAHRVTSGGIGGAYRGTCSLLGRCARALGKDVAAWLRNPTMGAKLGDEH
jgi:hypothetical protein